MTSSMNDQVDRYFTANMRDLTPEPVRHVATVIYVPLTKNPEVTRRCQSVLSERESLRAKRFSDKDNMDLFIQRRAFRRFCGASALQSSQPLSQIVFTETANGRPYLTALADTWFSFSSCRSGFLGAWSSTHGLGVDIETPTEKLAATELARQFFSAAEARMVDMAVGTERQWTFLQLWNLKEAALKSIGEGLPFGLKNFQFELHPETRVIHAPASHGGYETFDAHAIPRTGACAALVIRNACCVSADQSNDRTVLQ
jgi:4'-phosphopantetheinyl transferase